MVVAQGDFAKFRKIDAHSHVGKFGPPFNIDFDGERLREQMDDYNIEKTILTSSDSHLNAELDEVFRQMPDRVLPVAWVNPREGAPQYEMLERYLEDSGFVGAKLQSLFDAYCADDECVDPVADICERHHVPLFVHSGHVPYSTPWQIALMAERHPHLPVVMLHMGHGHGVYIDAAIKMAKRLPNIYLETSGMPMGCQIANAYRTVGKTRVMWGVDSPFHHPSAEVQRTMSCGLDDAELEDVFYNNAARLMGLRRKPLPEGALPLHYFIKASTLPSPD